jgi:hypothetical protein
VSRQSRLKAVQKRKGKKGGPGPRPVAPPQQQQVDAALRSITDAAKAKGIEVHVKRDRRQQKR